MLAKGLLVLSLLGSWSCVSGSKSSTQVEDVKPNEDTVVKKSSNNCQPLSGQLKNLPTFIQDKSLMINEFLRDCTTETGEKGYMKGSSWTAMGFPCTGGRGSVEWKGSVYAPKVVTFEFANNCPMNLSSTRSIETELRDILEIPEQSKLIALYPFSIVYWEVSDFRDADVGNKVELFSAQARKEAWNQFQRKEPIKVRLFGRENALVRTKHFYQVEGQIEKDGEENFIFKVDAVEVLKENQVAEIKKRCLKIKPRRNCRQLFKI